MTKYYPVRENSSPPLYFHMVANGYALFTHKKCEAMHVTKECEIAPLCEALEETDDEKWSFETVETL